MPRYKVKAYTRGWINEYGEMNLNVKFENSRSASSTIMVRPNDTLGSVIHGAVGFRKMCDDGDGECTVFVLKAIERTCKLCGVSC